MLSAAALIAYGFVKIADGVDARALMGTGSSQSSDNALVQGVFHSEWFLIRRTFSLNAEAYQGERSGECPRVKW